MADNRVKLHDPNGVEFYASTPAEVSNLVFGAGYKVADKGLSVDAAMAKLAESGPVADQLQAQQAVPQAPSGGGK
jgi:hypothetical protein